MRAVVIASLLALPVAAPAGGPAPSGIQGSWTTREYDQNGTQPPADLIRQMTVRIQADTIRIRPRIAVRYRPVVKNGKKEVEVVYTTAADQEDAIGYKLDPGKGRITLIWRGARGESETRKGVFRLEGDTLKICFPLSKNKRPKKFPDRPKAGVVRMVLKRMGG
jgi:uncharacterized protein (TIGR03067 family)